MKAVKYFNIKFISLLMLLLVSSSLYAESSAFFDQSLGDYSEELENARDDGKKGILLMFELDECPFCDRMAKTVLNKPEVIAYYKKHFNIFRINIEANVEITDFEGNTTTEKDFSFKVHRVRATPVIAFFDLTGKRVARYTGATTSVKEFLWLGEFVVEEHYKKMSFTRYKREKRKTSG